jgi:protein-disulfide isomerase
MILRTALRLFERSSFVRAAARVALLVMAPVLTGVAQDGANDAGITRKQADDILNELRQIRQLLEGQNKSAGLSPAAAPVPFTGRVRLDQGFSLGSIDAPLAMVEFTDYECPFCRQFQSTTFAGIRKQYIDTGKVRFVVRDFPLVNHPYAFPAAEAAHCAGDQGKFWPMHDALFSDPGQLVQKRLMEHAEGLKLDVDVFRSCLQTGQHKLEIQDQMQVATALQVQGTPSFLIGKITGGEVAGKIVLGALTLSGFEAMFKEAEVP